MTACNSEEDAVFKKSGNLETKPDASLLEELSPLNPDDDDAEPTVAADVTYRIKVESASETELCNGRVTLQVLSNFKMKFPEAVVNCISLRINLAGILGAQTDSNSGSASTGKLKHDGEVLSIEKIAGATFSPPRPVLLGPVVQDEEKYKNFAPRKTKHTLSAVAPDGSSVEGEGTFGLQVIKYPTTYKDGDTIFFDKVMHWEMTSQFDTPARYGLTFAKWTWYWNTRPIMIPGLVIEGSIKDFIESSTVETAAALTGDLKFKLEVEKYDIK